MHPRVKKIIQRTRKFPTHDEKEEARVGDEVVIEETRPRSKRKRWQLLEIVKRSEAGVATEEELESPEDNEE